MLKDDPLKELGSIVFIGGEELEALDDIEDGRLLGYGAGKDQQDPNFDWHPEAQ